MIVAIALVASLAVGCSGVPATPTGEAAVRATIKRYNELLTQGYRTMNMNPMQEVATDLQSQDEYIHMSSLAEGGIKLDSELKSLEFIKVSIEATSASAETRETWDYRQVSRTTGETSLEQKGLVYVLAWDLEQRPDGRWLVSDVRAISATTTLEPSIPGTATPAQPPGR